MICPYCHKETDLQTQPTPALVSEIKDGITTDFDVIDEGKIGGTKKSHLWLRAVPVYVVQEIQLDNQAGRV
jgi:hypothetical protein